MTKEKQAWKPKTWIATLLGFFLPPIGLLYVIRPWWALVYFTVSIGVGLLDYSLTINYNFSWAQYFHFSYVIQFIAAVHCFVAAKYQPVIQHRPRYSRFYTLVSVPIFVALSIFCFRAFVFEPFRDPSVSMEPTVPAGDVIWVKKWGYGDYGTWGLRFKIGKPWARIARGDIVAFRYPLNPKVVYVKRVIGLPGDLLKYRNKKLTINGKVIHDKIISDIGVYSIYLERIGNSTYHIALMSGRPSPSISETIPPNSYFVLGDNRDDSYDSRYWGYVPKIDIIGKAVHISK